jgi:hypothetical protein
MGPKNGKIMAKNQMGITTGNLAAALLHKLLHSCIPIAFSHTKYSGVQANPNVINCKHTKQILLCYLFIYVRVYEYTYQQNVCACLVDEH